MTDRIATAVSDDLAQRAAVGLRKYGVQLSDADLTDRQTIQHAYEEALDLASYLKRVLMTDSRAAEIEAAREEGRWAGLMEAAQIARDIAAMHSNGGRQSDRASSEYVASAIEAKAKEAVR